jgi:hypothetical protein
MLQVIEMRLFVGGVKRQQSFLNNALLENALKMRTAHRIR